MAQEKIVGHFWTWVASAFVLNIAIFSTVVSATLPARESSDYSPSLLLSQAATAYDDCVRAAARRYASQPEAIPVIVQKAEQACERQLTELQEQGRQDIAEPASQVPDLRRQVELLIGRSTAAARVSGFAEVGMIR